MKLDIDEIEVGKRKRKLDEGKIKSLAESFDSIGQLQPITVAKCEHGGYRMIAGLHRLEAAKLLGWETIEAQEFEGDAVTMELAEIDENLMRNDLTVLEQGEHLARRQELIGYKPRRPNKGEIISPLKATSEIAQDIGLTERSAQQRMQVARNIVPEVKDAICDTEIARLEMMVEHLRGVVSQGNRTIASMNRHAKEDEARAEQLEAMVEKLNGWIDELINAGNQPRHCNWQDHWNAIVYQIIKEREE